ncbi:MAG: caspase family protein [Rivularia sp. (in: cyanobacteria)]
MAKVALLIGISEYEAGLNPLPAAVQDVEAMRQVLGNPEMGGFADNDITVLKNRQPQDIRNAIYNLFANRHKDDLLLFYFSGHGIKDDRGKLYLSTRDTKKDNGRLVTPSAVPASYLHENINYSRSQRQVIILDCCFSGAIASGMTLKDDGSVNVQEQLGGKGRAILTSSTSTQYSFEQQGSELSVYTSYLVEGIKTGAADTDGDGCISIDELHEYASNKVEEVSPTMTPEFYPVKEGHKILLAKSRKDDPKLIYRQELERLAKRNQGNLSNIALIILEGKRNDLKISQEEATAIKDDVLKPYREYEHKCHEYEQTLIEAANKQYPFSQIIQKEIKDYQRYLGLRNEDIAAIEKRVLTPQQATGEHQQQQKIARFTEQVRQQEIEEQQTKDYIVATQVKQRETEESISKIVLDSEHNTVREKLMPGIFKSRKNVVAGVVGIIVLGVLGLITPILKKSPIASINLDNFINKAPDIKHPPQDLEKILNEVPQIKQATRLRKLNRRVYDRINLTWKNRQSLNNDLNYRVIAAGDGTVLSYIPLDESAQKYINQTPIPGVLYQLNNQTPIKNEPVAQFRVKFIKGGVLAVNPWIGYIYKTPDLLGVQITDTNQVKQLREKLYDLIWNNWRGIPTYPQNLKYRVAVRKDGAIADYEPINKAAFENFRKTPLPKIFSEISQSNISTFNDKEPLAHYQVIFSRHSPNGRLKVEPWQGYPRRESDD